MCVCVCVTSATLGGQLAGESLTCDGCHPKDAGLTIMAQTIAQTIAAVGEQQ